MKRNKAWIAAGLILLTIICLCVNVFVMEKFVRTYTYTELENRGYASQDVAQMRIDHSYLRRILGFNEWRISVEFKEVADVFFWFSYRSKKIIFEGVSSEPMMDTDSAIEYSESFKQGKLLSK